MTNEYALKFPNGKFAGFDASNGGQPFEVRNMTEVTTFPTIDAASEARGVNNPHGFTIYKIATVIAQPPKGRNTPTLQFIEPHL